MGVVSKPRFEEMRTAAAIRVTSLCFGNGILGLHSARSRSNITIHFLLIFRFQELDRKWMIAVEEPTQGEVLMSYPMDMGGADGARSTPQRLLKVLLRYTLFPKKCNHGVRANRYCSSTTAFDLEGWRRLFAFQGSQSLACGPDVSLSASFDWRS